MFDSFVAPWDSLMTLMTMIWTNMEIATGEVSGDHSTVPSDSPLVMFRFFKVTKAITFQQLFNELLIGGFGAQKWDEKSWYS